MAGFFSEIYDFFYTLFNQIVAAFANIRFFDIIDIIIVTFVIYKGIELFRETRAKQLLKGIAILFAVWVIAQWFDLISLKWILVKVVDYAIIAVAIIFQPELRRALERVGRSNFGLFNFGQSSQSEREEVLRCIDAVCKAAGSMQEQRVGALMVFERNTLIGEIINTGTVIDAEASPELICNVFYPKSPLHDGAMVIRDGRINAAGCILPLTPNNNINKALGTRHRAAIGMSENSDALVVVVSEETGNISLAVNGQITRDFNPITLREQLNKYILPELDENSVKGIRKLLYNKRKNKNHENK